MKCARCNKRAEIELKYSGEFLCGNCFIRLFEKRVRRNIRSNRLLKPTDKTAVALSGGKDSTVVLHILNDLHKRAPRSELIAISIDQGMGKFQEKSLNAAKAICKKLGVKQYVYSFGEEFGLTMDEIVERSKRLKNPAPACSYCGVLRRKLLNDKARELGITKIATGHNLDDEIQSSLMNFIRGDLDRIARMGAIAGVIKNEKFIPRIKPLRECPEEEVRVYAGLKRIEFETSRCPYSEDAFRRTIREVIDRIEERHPGSKFQILKSTDRLISILRSETRPGEIGRCRICGDLTSGDLCKACQIKREFGLD
ncbi:MAG: TIGR00269 family protein [Candidatus Altiarchaeales archaeon]|nr:MAG: TIGR00269 family protein [Candidatus Altiarchaeales archaeon]